MWLWAINCMISIPKQWTTKSEGCLFEIAAGRQVNEKGRKPV
jgi:hypothetical protein